MCSEAESWLLILERGLEKTWHVDNCLQNFGGIYEERYQWLPLREDWGWEAVWRKLEKRARREGNRGGNLHFLSFPLGQEKAAKVARLQASSKDSSREGRPYRGGHHRVYLWNRRGGSFRELNQKKPHLWENCCVDIRRGASPKNSPVHQQKSKHRASAIKKTDNWTSAQESLGRGRRVTSFSSDAWESRGHAWVRP